MKEKGFTLIELLVVIVIIGILSGVIYYTIDPDKRQKEARDANKVTAVEGIRTEMVNYFVKNNNSFENAGDDAKIKEIVDNTATMVLESDANN
jgi:prepilin-type N-terminal cleavage/methylation domain-containing protein